MREILKECAEVMRRGQLDEMESMAGRIDAALAAPKDDALEIVRRIRAWDNNTCGYKYALTDSEAAALIQTEAQGGEG